MDDLLARIAKALDRERGEQTAGYGCECRMAAAARTLLPEAHAALTIAVEALEFCRDESYCALTRLEGQLLENIVVERARDDIDGVHCQAVAALSCLASAAEGKAEPSIYIAPHSVNPSDPRYGGHPTRTFPPCTCQSCPVHGQPSGEGK